MANPTAHRNTAVGARTLATSSGEANTAVGSDALATNDGSWSTAVGASALGASNGSGNAAFGAEALALFGGGHENTGIGRGALFSLTSGSFNLAVGRWAGSSLTSGSSNIYIGHPGLVTESNTMRLGSGSARAFIAGVRGVTTVAENAIPVLIDSLGQLGTASSSRRVKQDITTMADRTRGLYDLRPVTFRYTSHAEAGSTTLEYGLIAEEVADVYPDLVVRNDRGEIETVQYHKLAPMLLNELQRLERERAALARRLDAQAHEVAALRDAVAALTRQRHR